MGERTVVAFSITEGLKWWNLNIIQFLCVVGLVSAMADRCSKTAEKLLCMFDACYRIERWNGLGVVDFGQGFDLLDVEDRIALHVWDFVFDVFASFLVVLGARNGI